MKTFGKVHPSHRSYHQWLQMEENERQLHRADMADLYIATAERFEHNAIFLHPNPDTVEETLHLIDLIRAKTGDRYFLMRHGDATFSIPSGSEMASFAYRLADEPVQLKAEGHGRASSRRCSAPNGCKSRAVWMALLSAPIIVSTQAPFSAPRHFREFVTPYLVQLVKGYRDLGFYVIKHTDGNIMPILDQLLEANPHALHSLDPQAGVDIGRDEAALW